MSPLRRVQPGVPLTARLWNELVDEIAAIRNINSDGSVQISRSGGAGVHLSVPLPGQGVWFANKSASGVPPFGAVQVLNTINQTASGNPPPALLCDAPIQSSPATKMYLLNGDTPVRAASGSQLSYGFGYLTPPNLSSGLPLTALYDNSATPQPGDIWVPANGQFALTKLGSSGGIPGPHAFEVHGIIDTVAQTMWVSPLLNNTFACIAASGVAAASGTAPGSGTATL